MARDEALRTIFLLADDVGKFRRALSTAVSLAADHNAHLTGCAVLARTRVLPAGMPGTPDVLTIDAGRTASAKAAKGMQREFERAARQAGVEVDWLLGDAEKQSAAKFIVHHASVADLVVAGLPDVSWGQLGLFDIEASLMTGTGRPTLLVPKSPTAHSLAQHILVAWNASREAARAVFDCLPLFRQAAQITLLTVCEDLDSRNSGVNSLRPLQNSLSRHGICARIEVFQVPQVNVGAAILAEAKACTADLLVMGCYGHSRIREFVLGGVTRHVLQQTSIPVFMSN